MVGVFMPWGKHRGQPLSALPTGYLRWLANGCNSLDATLAWHVQAELRGRGERFLPAAAVLTDIEDEVDRQLSEADVSHQAAAVLGDVVLQAFEVVRQRCGIGRETELHVPAKGLGERGPREEPPRRPQAPPPPPRRRRWLQTTLLFVDLPGADVHA